MMVAAGLRAGAWGGAALTGWLMFCAEVGAAPTTVPGVQSSTWTPVTAVAALVFGRDALHGSFRVLPILAGLVLLAVACLVLGVAEAFVIGWTLGPWPGPVGAALLGLGFGLAVQILVVDVVINALQDPDDLYKSLPPWGWWVGLATFGVVCGLRLARRGMGPR
jgi:hypothetical protein